MIFKRKPKSKLIATVISENRLGFKIPCTERVELFSYNTTKKSLKREFEREGVVAIKASISPRNLIKIENIRFEKMDGTEIK